MASRPTRPADSFQRGERVFYKGHNHTVINARYLGDDRRLYHLALLPDGQGTGYRLDLQSGDDLEEGDPFTISQHVRHWLRTRLPRPLGNRFRP